jgi:cation diffusion facilitator family transporter
LGFLLLRHGKNIRSSALQADGHHLLSDAYTSAGLLVGLAVAWFTGIVWLDSALALAFAGLLLFTGYRLVRRALAGLMDAADMELLPKVIQTLAENRRPRWIDIHNLRVVQYGGSYHIDAHLTLPWYVNLEEAHEEVTAMEHIAATHFHDALELFVHADPCIPRIRSVDVEQRAEQPKTPTANRLGRAVFVQNQQRLLGTENSAARCAPAEKSVGQRIVYMVTR